MSRKEEMIELSFIILQYHYINGISGDSKELAKDILAAGFTKQKPLDVKWPEKESGDPRDFENDYFSQGFNAGIDACKLAYAKAGGFVPRKKWTVEEIYKIVTNPGVIMSLTHALVDHINKEPE